jgi:hypothetical protein
MAKNKSPFEKGGFRRIFYLLEDCHPPHLGPLPQERGNLNSSVDGSWSNEKGRRLSLLPEFSIGLIL